MRMMEMKPRQTMNNMQGGRVIANPFKLSSGAINKADGVLCTILKNDLKLQKKQQPVTNMVQLRIGLTYYLLCLSCSTLSDR